MLADFFWLVLRDASKLLNDNYVFVFSLGYVS